MEEGRVQSFRQIGQKIAARSRKNQQRLAETNAELQQEVALHDRLAHLLRCIHAAANTNSPPSHNLQAIRQLISHFQ